MKTDYFHWYSEHLDQEMELKSYGHAGKPALVFPAQGGRFYEFEDFGMTTATEAFIADGQIQFFTVDSVDNQSWANWEVHPEERARRHEQYDRYICEEVIPFIHEQTGSEQRLLTTGVSMGGYHSGNFFFRHPDLFDTLVALSGLFQLRMFVGDYCDDNVYFNSPLLYLPKLTDPDILDLYRSSDIIICVGQGAWEELMQADARAMQTLLDEHNVPAWVDFWGYDVNHDWPWWRKQLPYFLGHLFA
jgi:esterase/lipase superfamily enzyme